MQKFGRDLLKYVAIIIPYLGKLNLNQESSPNLQQNGITEIYPKEAAE